MAITPFKVIDFCTNRKLTYDFLLMINILTYLLSCTVSKLCLIIGQIFASKSGVPNFNALPEGYPLQYRHKSYIAKTRFFGLYFRCKKYWCIFNYDYVIGPESYRIQ